MPSWAHRFLARRSPWSAARQAAARRLRPQKGLFQTSSRRRAATRAGRCGRYRWSPYRTPCSQSSWRRCHLGCAGSCPLWPPEWSRPPSRPGERAHLPPLSRSDPEVSETKQPQAAAGAGAAAGAAAGAVLTVACSYPVDPAAASGAAPAKRPLAAMVPHVTATQTTGPPADVGVGLADVHAGWAVRAAPVQAAAGARSTASFAYCTPSGGTRFVSSASARPADTRPPCIDGACAGGNCALGPAKHSPPREASCQGRARLPALQIGNPPAHSSRATPIQAAHAASRRVAGV